MNQENEKQQQEITTDSNVVEQPVEEQTPKPVNPSLPRPQKIPAPVGNRITQGLRNPFAGTSWGN